MFLLVMHVNYENKLFRFILTKLSPLVRITNQFLSADNKVKNQKVMFHCTTILQ